MTRIPPPLRSGVSTDSQCTAPGYTCGQPESISNQNLEKSVGGQPGFITISRHMCIGDSIESGVFTNPSYSPVLGKTVKKSETAARSQYPYACGFFDYNTSESGSAVNGTNTLWNATHRACSQWFDFFCHVFYGCFKDNEAYLRRDGMGSTMIMSYLTNPNQPKRLRQQAAGNPYSSNRYYVKFEGVVPLIKNATRTKDTPDIKIHSIIRHPKMNIEKLRHFGVYEEDFDKILVAAPGTTIQINYGCYHSEGLTVSVAFFKWDLSTIVEHNGRRTLSGGRFIDDFVILSEKINDAGDDVADGSDMHGWNSLTKYTLYSGWFRNGANRGNTGQWTGTRKITLPLEPFYDPNTIMVVMVSNLSPAYGRYSNSRQTHFKDITSTDWSTTGGYKQTGLPVRYPGGGDGVHCGCTFDIKVPEHEEDDYGFVGCSQTRNNDWLLYSNPGSSVFRTAKPESGSKPDQIWKSPSTGSHIIKIVSSDYYRRECTYRITPSIFENIDNSQNSVVYASMCLSDVGDPYINSNSVLGKESRLGSYYEEKCNSYSMNISPNSTITNISRCCIPKVSGPFLIEPNPHGETAQPFKNDILNDGPDIESNYRPNLNFYSQNLSYHLENRIYCECDTPGCVRSKCYTCPSRTKSEYEICITSPTCGLSSDKADCCVDPCAGSEGLTRDQCLLSPYNEKGCCIECTDCTAQNQQEYNDCITDKTGTIFSRNKCKLRGCCNAPCDICDPRYESCLSNNFCNANGCCNFNCSLECSLKDEFAAPNTTDRSLGGHPVLNNLRNLGGGIDSYPPVWVNKTLNDYWSCINKQDEYSDAPMNLCGDKCCCASPCDKYLSGYISQTREGGSGSPGSYLPLDCINDATCMAEGCLAAILEASQK